MCVLNFTTNFFSVKFFDLVTTQSDITITVPTLP